MYSLVFFSMFLVHFLQLRQEIDPKNGIRSNIHDESIARLGNWPRLGSMSVGSGSHEPYHSGMPNVQGPIDSGCRCPLPVLTATVSATVVGHKTRGSCSFDSECNGAKTDARESGRILE